MASPLKPYQIAITWVGIAPGELRKWRVKGGASVNQGDDLAMVLSSGKLQAIKSPSKGIFEAPLVREGQQCKPGETLAIVNACKHDVVHGGVCVTCSVPVNFLNLSHTALPTGQIASVAVNRQMAEERHQQLVERLLASRKLYLVLDLDLTVLQATIEKLEDTKKIEAYRKAGFDIREFALDEHKYLVKFRPGIKEFLNEIAEHFDVHVYTLGQRTYAENITKMLDEFIDNPSKKLFKDGYSRIMTRSESREMESKNLRNVLQHGDQIAVIIDDREEVWRQSIGNLLPAKPYDFFKGHGDIHDPTKLKSGNNTVEKAEEWFSPAMQNLIAEGKIPKPENYEEKLKKQEEREAEKRGMKRPREDGSAEDEDEEDSPLAKYAKLSSEKSPSVSAPSVSVFPSIPSIRPASTSSSLPTLGLAKPAIFPLNPSDMKSKLKSLPSLKKAKTDASAASPPVEASPIESTSPSAASPPDSPSLSSPNPETPSHSPVQSDFEEKHSSEEPKEPNPREEEPQIPIPEDNDRILFSITAALKKVHRHFFEEYDRTRSLPDVKRAIDIVRRDTFRHCNLTFSHMIPSGVDLKKDRTWTRSQWFGATCSVDLKPGETTHLVCGRAGTDKLRAALKSPHPLFLVNGKWLQDSMDNFQRMDESKYQLVDNEAVPPQVLPVYVSGLPRIGPSKKAESEKPIEREEVEKLSLAYSQSVEEAPSEASSPRMELESDLKEAKSLEGAGEKDDNEDDEDDENIIDMDDISSDLSEEELEIQVTSTHKAEKEDKGSEEDENDNENDEEDSIDPNMLSAFNTDLLKSMQGELDEDFDANHGDADEAQSEGNNDDMDVDNDNLDYGDGDNFEDDDEGGDN